MPRGRSLGQGKNAAPLLKQVNGKRHASVGKDKTPVKDAAVPKTFQRISQSPLSSGDEKEPTKIASLKDAPSTKRKTPSKSKIKTLDSEDNRHGDHASELSNSNRKRKRDETSSLLKDVSASEKVTSQSAQDKEDEIFFSSQSQSKKSSKSYGRRSLGSRSRTEEKGISSQNSPNTTSTKRSSFKAPLALSNGSGLQTAGAQFKTPGNLTATTRSTLRRSNGDMLQLTSSVDEAPSSSSSFKLPSLGASFELEDLPRSSADRIPDEVSDESDTDLDLGLIGARPRCPACEEPVPEVFLEELPKLTHRMDIHAQIAFCKAHKRRTAQQEYLTRGYPQVDWDGIEERFHHHLAKLREITAGQRSSHFRDEYTKKLKETRPRTFSHALKGRTDTIDTLTSGYYGSRGARRMQDFIIKNLSTAVEDMLLSQEGLPYLNEGVSGFTQAVLVPELATCLIQEDLALGFSDACQILEESSKIGEWVNEEEDEQEA